MGKAELDAPLSAAPFLFHVGKVDQSKFAVPPGYAQNSRGYTRQSLVERSVGTAHMGVGVCRLEPQAPQFPAQHASRNYAAWERMRLRMKSGK